MNTNLWRNLLLLLSLTMTLLSGGSMAWGEELEAVDSSTAKEDFYVSLFGSYASNRHDPSAYYQIRRDFRKCMAPLCGGYWIKEVNRNKTTCNSYLSAEECYVARIDWAGLEVKNNLATGYDGTLPVLVKGKIVKDHDSFIWSVNQLVAEEAWLAAVEGKPAGKFLQVQNSGIVCITTPCPTIQSHTLNRPQQSYLNDLDFASRKIPQEMVDRAYGQLAKEGEKLLVAGKVQGIRGPGGLGRSLEVTQLYFPVTVANTTSPCLPTGCSGQICSDRNMATTCEYRPEYACIQQQVCERQSNGMCGWTPTTASSECFNQLPANGTFPEGSVDADKPDTDMTGMEGTDEEGSDSTGEDNSGHAVITPVNSDNTTTITFH